MRPAFTLVFASKGDAITGINRADSASVSRYPISGDPAHYGELITRVLRQSPQCACDHRIIAQVPQHVKVPVSTANDLAAQVLTRAAYPPPRVRACEAPPARPWIRHAPIVIVLFGQDRRGDLEPKCGERCHLHIDAVRTARADGMRPSANHQLKPV